MADLMDWIAVTYVVSKTVTSQSLQGISGILCFFRIQFVQLSQTLCSGVWVGQAEISILGRRLRRHDRSRDRLPFPSCLCPPPSSWAPSDFLFVTPSGRFEWKAENSEIVLSKDMCLTTLIRRGKLPAWPILVLRGARARYEFSQTIWYTAEAWLIASQGAEPAGLKNVPPSWFHHPMGYNMRISIVV